MRTPRLAATTAIAAILAAGSAAAMGGGHGGGGHAGGGHSGGGHAGGRGGMGGGHGGPQSPFAPGGWAGEPGRIFGTTAPMEAPIIGSLTGGAAQPFTGGRGTNTLHAPIVGSLTGSLAQGRARGEGFRVVGAGRDHPAVTPHAAGTSVARASGPLILHVPADTQSANFDRAHFAQDRFDRQRFARDGFHEDRGWSHDGDWDHDHDHIHHVRYDGGYQFLGGGGYAAPAVADDSGYGGAPVVEEDNAGPYQSAEGGPCGVGDMPPAGEPGPSCLEQGPTPEPMGAGVWRWDPSQRQYVWLPG